MSCMRWKKTQGSVCEQGSGKGRCATALLNLIEVSSTSRKQLIEQNGLASPIISQIQELQDSIRRTASNTDLGYDRKSELLQENITLMTGEIEALSKTLPIATILHASDSFARDWSSMGLGDVGSRRITAEFRPIADRLKREIGSLKATSEVEIHGIKNLSEYELLAQSKEALPIIGIATLLACLPLLLSVCVLGISGGYEPAKDDKNNNDGTDTFSPQSDKNDQLTPHLYTSSTKHH